MNILFISTQLYPCKIGGVELFNYYLINALVKKNDIWVITSCDTNFNQKNVNVIKINTKKLCSQKLSVFYEHSKNILKIRDKIDVAHIPYTSTSWLYGCYLPILKKLCKLPYLLSLHGGGMYPWKPKLPHKLLFQNADAIVAVSKTMKEEYEKRSGRKIIYIPNLLPFTRSKKSECVLKKRYHFSEKDIIILAFGTIKKIKGSDILLESFLQLGKNYVEKNYLKLLFVGTGPMKAKLEQIVRVKGFEKSVKFFGYVEEEKKPEIYKLSDIYIIPSLIEGLPISLLEAMYNGLPVIGTDTTGINQLIKDFKTGLLFPKGNSDILKKKIKLLTENKDLRNELVENGRKMIRSFYNYDEMLDKYLEAYEQAKERC